MSDCLIKPLKWIVTEVLWPPVKLHINYWWCFDGNVQGLRDEIGDLKREMSNRNQKIEEARLLAEIATTDGQNWLNEGSRELVEATRILQGCDDLKLWNIIQRYSVGKSAKKTAEGISKLRNEGTSIRIADPAPPAAMVPSSHAPTLEFQSRKSMEEDIIEYLKDGNVRMIAICGAGGVGKTTMARRIEDRAIKEKLFDEVVTVVISQQIDMFKIQKEIAEMLGLPLSEETLAVRAHKLRIRLKDSKKKLIIFDDVWKSFKPEDIGVPYGGEKDISCKIILTSRLKDVCEEMKADKEDKVTEIQVLDKEEAWTLFREKSGDCVDDLSLLPIAEEVAAECKGLPIALATVGIALKDKSIHTWRDALLQLKGANPTNFPQVLQNVYMPLKLSYDFLDNESEKSLFLLCCLFPEDYNIPIEDLALLSFGLGMFEGINNIEDGRNRTYHLLERLRSRFLLMTGRYEQEVKMHDVVRDVAIFIGSKEKQGFLNVCSMDLSSKDSSRNCNWMSVDISIANAKLPVGLDFRNLRLLMILKSSYSEFPGGFDVNDIYFEGMEELTVLYLRDLIKLEKIIDGTIPEGSNSFQNLGLVSIQSCSKLGYLWKSPNQNVSLVNLKSIRIEHCPNLRYLFSMATARSLVQLQSLQIFSCDTIEQVLWNEVESNTEASIIELFPKLKNLKLFFLPNLLAFTQGVEIIKFPQLIQLEIIKCPKLRTKIGQYPTSMIENIDVRYCDTMEEIFRDDGNRHIIFQKLRELRLGDLPSLTTFYRGVESIKFPKLKELTIGKLPRLNSFVPILDSEPTAHDHHSLHFFCSTKVEIIGLERLYLWKLPDKISKIWCPHIPISFFRNLETLYIYYVNGIRNLISSSIAKDLVNLNRLDIRFCEEMIDAIEDETHETVNSIFPNLEILIIGNNCNLRSFCQWKHDVELPSLETVRIVDCPLMKTFTLGSLSTPKLYFFEINFNDIEMKDLNGGIHQFTSAETMNKDENKGEYNEDEKHEDKREIEGEEKIESSNNNLM